MIAARSCSSTLLVALFLFGCWGIHAQSGEENLSASEKAYIASQIYSSVQIYFAHKAGIADLDFDAAYKLYLDYAMSAKDRREFDLATLEFVAKLRNKHTQFDDQWLRRKYGQPLGFRVLPVEGKWTIISAQNKELRKGDVVRAIDGMEIETFVSDKQRYINASSERSARSLVFDRAYLFPSRFTLELEDGRKISIERRELPQSNIQDIRPPASEGRWLFEGAVGYIKIPAFNDPNYEKTALEFARQYHAAKCLIIDVRGNGGGSTPYALIRELMDREWRSWGISTPAQVALHRARGEPVAQLRIESERQMPRQGAFTGKVILLVDRFTCSATEDFVMAFKDNGRATIIGETTEGSSGQPYFFNFGNGMTLLVGTVRYTFPDGSPFESVGIKPTIPVELRIADLRNGIDPVLNKAKEMAGIP